MVRPGMVARHSAKAVFLASTVLLALAGAGAAEERDPRLKDPTIDFNTVDLSTLPPLQFTFVPEWRKLEGFRRLLNSAKLEDQQSYIAPGQDKFCKSFWSDILNDKRIYIAEPVLRTNYVKDVSNSELQKMCPDKNLEYLIPTQQEAERHELYRARYGMRIFDISQSGKKIFVYARAGFSRPDPSAGHIAWPVSSADLSERLSRKDPNGSSLRESEYYWFSELVCDGRQYGVGVETPYIFEDVMTSTSYSADSLIIKIESQFYTLRVIKNDDAVEFDLHSLSTDIINYSSDGTKFAKQTRKICGRYGTIRE